MGEGVGSRPAAGGSRAEEPIFPAGRSSRRGGKIGGAARSRGGPFPHGTIGRPEQSDPAPPGARPCPATSRRECEGCPSPACRAGRSGPTCIARGGVTSAPDVFGDVCLVREWDRIGRRAGQRSINMRPLRKPVQRAKHCCALSCGVATATHPVQDHGVNGDPSRQKETPAGRMAGGESLLTAILIADDAETLRVGHHEVGARRPWRNHLQAARRRLRGAA